jgi:hypothetical protein
MALGLEADLTTAMLVVKESQLPSEEEGRFLYKEFCKQPSEDRGSMQMYPGFAHVDSDDSGHAGQRQQDLYLNGDSISSPRQLVKGASVKLAEAFNSIKQPWIIEDSLQMAM